MATTSRKKVDRSKRLPKGLLQDFSKQSIIEDMESIRADNQFDCVLRRGDKVLEAFPARLNIVGNLAREFDTRASQTMQSPTLLMAPPNTDMQEGDRFTYQGDEYRIKLVRPTRWHATIAETLLVQ